MSNQFTDISQSRFDALGGYCRGPTLVLFSREIRWLQAWDETILIAVVEDQDGDFTAIAFTRDLNERYRFFGMSAFFDTPAEVMADLPELIARVMKEFEEHPAQGDEKRKSVDFFTPIVAEAQLNADFKKLTTLEQFSPALELIKPMMRWHEDADGNFIQQFQTTGFDTRLWELYIFAMLVEARHALNKEDAIPDFCAISVSGKVCIEATSVNPSLDADGKKIPPPSLDTPEQLRQFQQNYMPIRYAGPLTKKLQMKYWERENVKGRPFVMAIQDFHAPGSMAYSRTALPIYLYGMDWDPEQLASGELVIKPRRVLVHQWGTKTVESGFFNLPGAENISAVITNASADISKFNRMGIMTGFGSKRVKIVRRGMAADPNPNSSSPRSFVHDVNAADYVETWIEGLDVYHNPNALAPLNPQQFPGAAHHRLRRDGQLETSAPIWHPFNSSTAVFLKD
ncbi:hypothetical protein ACEN9F_10965 [Duganella sp. CT11-25]|uniref:hypothetical protein n=1 Tax=unclassified Duganella TaxID=2636909 RepID=UPI0039B0F04E